MRLAIGKVLQPAQLDEIRGLLDRAAFEDGRRTAGAAARQVKNNLQLAPASEEYRRASEIVRAALEANEAFQAAALPRAMSAPLFARYEAGMGYGAHVDNALMRGPDLRTDLAFTLFLAEPGDYEGGELVLQEAEGENSIKLEAGDLFIYPATTVHRVEAVRSGRREVCVGWVQSLVRDPRVREMVFDLARAKLLTGEGSARPEAHELLAKTLSNLLRMHIEP
jgi:PKHD-type hydroxylase